MSWNTKLCQDDELNLRKFPVASSRSESLQDNENDDEPLETKKKSGSAVFKINNNVFQLQINDLKPSPDEGSKSLKKEIVKANLRQKASICVTNSRYSVISKVAKLMGYKLVKETHLWNILWADAVPGVEVYKEMKRFQKINHFPGMQEICRKDLLARNLNRMLKLFPDDYEIFPRTWVFPADLGDAITFNKDNRSKTFILKPDQGAQGRGIWLTKNLKLINPLDRMICQVYLDKPLLLDGYKFDLRVYTLITSVDPLRIFVYDEGLARFATNKYKEPNCCNTSDMYMHLTNYAVNKHSHTFCKDEEEGSKRKFSTVNRRLFEEGVDVDALWRNIDDVIIKTILSSWPMLRHNYHACFSNHDVMKACFEILGFDILIDRKCKPFVLEVNHSPSFHTDENIDREVKEALVRDTLSMLNTSGVDKKKILNDDKKRVKFRLLKKKQESLVDNNKSPSKNQPPLSSLVQQIAWEDVHSGGYRRVMPPARDANKYCKYFFLQNEASIYSSTATSMRRAEAAKKFRNSIIAKQNKEPPPKSPKKRPAYVKTANIAKERKLNARRRRDVLLFHEKWSPGFISDMEERERREFSRKQSKIVREVGLLEALYEAIYLKRNLGESDKRQYPDLYAYCQDNISL